MTKWIPVTERQPEKAKNWYDMAFYLTCNASGRISVTSWHDGWNCNGTPDGSIVRTFEMKDIVAWMELPEPYRQEVTE